MLTKPITKFTDTRRVETELQDKFKFIDKNFQKSIPHFDDKTSADKAKIEDNAFVTVLNGDSVILYRKINGKLLPVKG